VLSNAKSAGYLEDSRRLPAAKLACGDHRAPDRLSIISEPGRAGRVSMRPSLTDKNDAGKPVLLNYLTLYFHLFSGFYGGEGGIRTPGSLSTTPDFESGAFNRALPPLREVMIIISVTYGVFPVCRFLPKSIGVRWSVRSISA
jgi:hypothetical protein